MKQSPFDASACMCERAGLAKEQKRTARHQPKKQVPIIVQNWWNYFSHPHSCRLVARVRRFAISLGGLVLSPETLALGTLFVSVSVSCLCLFDTRCVCLCLSLTLSVQNALAFLHHSVWRPGALVAFCSYVPPGLPPGEKISVGVSGRLGVPWELVVVGDGASLGAFD